MTEERLEELKRAHSAVQCIESDLNFIKRILGAFVEDENGFAASAEISILTADNYARPYKFVVPEKYMGEVRSLVEKMLEDGESKYQKAKSEFESM